MENFEANFPKINIGIKKGFFAFIFLCVKNKRLGVKKPENSGFERDYHIFENISLLL